MERNGDDEKVGEGGEEILWKPTALTLPPYNLSKQGCPLETHY